MLAEIARSPDFLQQRPPSGRNVAHHPDPGWPRSGHRSRSVAALAARIAALPGFGRLIENGVDLSGAYLVPDATLVSGDAARLGLKTDADLFGGVTPAKVTAGKAIAHLLPCRDSPFPAGWSANFAEAAHPHTLPGFSAFTRADACAAARAVLKQGPVRIKPAWAEGGLQQAVAHDFRDAEAIIDRMPPMQLFDVGAALELNLTEVKTYSVGRVRVGTLEMAYIGVQTTTTDNRGDAAYGGSRLLCARGGFADLASAPLPAAIRQALDHARAFDAAADRCLDGFFASRRNYDVALGRDPQGAMRAGVLEQSWRIGGASGAEIAALRAFADDDELRLVIASCREAYGRRFASLPATADIYFADDDPAVGPLIKYALIESASRAT
jgi:hypothetical protein